MRAPAQCTNRKNIATWQSSPAAPREWRSPRGDGHENRDNNEYVSAFAKLHADRITAWVDVDSMWSAEHHKPGAAERLKIELERFNVKGFTHYVTAKNDGWLVSDEGLEFFAQAAQSQVVASLSISADWFEDLRIVAAEYPTLPVLIHHMSIPKRETTGYDARDVEQLLECAKNPAKSAGWAGPGPCWN